MSEVRKIEWKPSTRSRLEQIAEESERQHEGLIKKWLKLGQDFFDHDSDPTPDAA